MAEPPSPAPAVSIIVPTFNRLQYLPPAIESVLAQTYRDWELIIADDGSDAETRAYLSRLENPPRIRVLWLPHSGNPAVVRNAAVREARGEYVAFQDSDDLWMPGKLAAQIASLEAHPERGWSHTSFTPVDASGVPLNVARERWWPPAEGWILERLISMDAVIALPSVVAHRRLFNQVGGFDTGQRMCEDYDLWLRLAARSEIDAVHEPLLLVRRHGEHSGDDPTAFEDRGRALEKLLSTGIHRSLDSLVRRERAKAAAGLARSHSISGNRSAVVRVILRAPRYAWRYGAWWLGAVAAAARAFAPKGLRRMVRRWRARRAGSRPGSGQRSP